MPASRHKRLAVIQRRVRVAELYVRGWTQHAIAQEVGIAQPTVCADLHRIRDEWRKSAVRDFDSARELELRKIELIEREAWSAWERSKQPAQSAVVTGEDIAKRTRKSVQQRYGDPRFLDIIHKCVAQRRAILGLDIVVVDAPITSPGVPGLPAPATAESELNRLTKIALKLGLGNIFDPPRPPADLLEGAPTSQTVEGMVVPPENDPAPLQENVPGDDDPPPVIRFWPQD